MISLWTPQVTQTASPNNDTLCMKGANNNPCDPTSKHAVPQHTTCLDVCVALFTHLTVSTQLTPYNHCTHEAHLPFPSFMFRTLSKISAHPAFKLCIIVMTINLYWPLHKVAAQPHVEVQLRKPSITMISHLICTFPHASQQPLRPKAIGLHDGFPSILLPILGP